MQIKQISLVGGAIVLVLSLAGNVIEYIEIKKLKKNKEVINDAMDELQNQIDEKDEQIRKLSYINFSGRRQGKDEMKDLLLERDALQQALDIINERLCEIE